MKQVIIVLITLVVLISCNKISKEEQAEIDKSLIEQYVSDNNLTGEFTSTGLWYDIETQGTGEQAYSNAQVTVAYSGYLLMVNNLMKGLMKVLLLG